MGEQATSGVTRDIDLGPVTITVRTDAGPRIVRYRRGDHQPFADLPDTRLEHPTAGTFRFVGGHRVWRSPENPEVTYQPDDAPVDLELIDDGLVIVGSPDRDGVVKTIAVRQLDQLTIVDHSFRNDGAAPVECAVWAITQLTPGGVAVVPHRHRAVDPDGVLPNRSLALWPYTDLSDPELELRGDHVRVASSDRSAKTKIGTENRSGWLAYVTGTSAFAKWSPLHRDDHVYPDLGSSIECYRDHRFAELESLGPLTSLEPGESVDHREVWRHVEDTSIEALLSELPADPLGDTP